MSNKDSSRKNIPSVRRIIFITLLYIVLMLIGFFLNIISFLALHPGFPLSTYIPLILTLVAFATVVIGLLSPLINNLFSAKEIATKQRKHIRVGDISTRFRLRTEEEANDALLAVEKERLDLERQKIELEREQESIVWQREALKATQVSPQSSITIAWIGVEQELNRTASRLNLLGLKSDIDMRSIIIIKELGTYGYMENQDIKTLDQMRDMRNMVLHSNVKDSDVGVGEALSYVEDAIDITQKLASLKKKRNTD